MNDELKKQAANKATKLKYSTKDVANVAASQASQVADDAKDVAAGQISGVASALREAASGLTKGSAAERTLGQIANGFADASESLHDRDFGELISAASDVAKRNPVLFIGGAVLLGFAASRFLKASAPVSAYDPTEDYTV